MNRVNLNNIVMAPLDGSEKYIIKNSYSDIQKHESYSKFNHENIYTYKEYKYEYELAAYPVNLTNLVLYYSPLDKNYYIKGKCNLKIERSARVTNTIKLNSKITSTTTRTWDAYNDYLVNLQLLVDGNIAYDFGSIVEFTKEGILLKNNGDISFDFEYRLGTTKPDNVTISIGFTDKSKVIIYTNGDRDTAKSDDIKTISFNYAIDSRVIILPDFTISDSNINIGTVTLNSIIYNKEYLRDYKVVNTNYTDVFQYKIETSDINFTNLRIIYDEETKKYYIDGTCTFDYNKKTKWIKTTYKSDGRKIDQLSFPYFKDYAYQDYVNLCSGRAYDDSDMNFVVYINDIAAINLGRPQEGITNVNEFFQISIGETLPDKLVISLKLDGDLLFYLEAFTDGVVVDKGSVLSYEDISNLITVKENATEEKHIISFDNITLKPEDIVKQYDETGTYTDPTPEYSYNYKNSHVYKVEFLSLDYEIKPTIEITNLRILKDNASGEYSILGRCNFKYKRNAMISTNKQYQDSSKTESQDWTDYDDSSCKINLYINGNLSTELATIIDTETIDSDFNYNLGTTLPPNIVLTISLVGQISGTTYSNNDPFTIDINDLICSKIINTSSSSKEQEDTSLASSISTATTVDVDQYIEKDMVAFEGWRYLIGIRDINIRKREFVQQSEIITKKFTTNKPIKKIMLYTNEIIPEEFLELGLEFRNEWIKYYISINDIDWFRISPMHHSQVGELTIPPKIYEINSTDSIEERNNQLNKGYINSKEDVYSVRLKIVFTRPTTITTLTPILEEYALKCVLEGEI